VEDDMCDVEEKNLILRSLLRLSVFYVKKMVAGGINVLFSSSGIQWASSDVEENI